MHPPIRVHALTVSNNQSKEFFNAIEGTLQTMTPLQLHEVNLLNPQLEAINISYNDDWQPFFGFTSGFTHDEERVYLPEGIWLLSKIREYLENLNLKIKGGRVSINSIRVYKRLDDKRLLDLCLFTWQGDDVWQKCNWLLMDARNRAHPT